MAAVTNNSTIISDHSPLSEAFEAAVKKPFDDMIISSLLSKAFEDVITKSLDKKVEQVRNNIYILSSDADVTFVDGVKEVLKQIEANPIGKCLLKKIDRLAGKIFISYGECNKHSTRLSDTERTSFISFSLKDTTCFSTEGTVIDAPKEVILFHELVHASHRLANTMIFTKTIDPLIWGSDEEYYTIIGLPRDPENITENAFRREAHLPLRFGALDTTDATDLSIELIKIAGAMYKEKITHSNPPPIIKIPEVPSSNLLIKLLFEKP